MFVETNRNSRRGMHQTQRLRSGVIIRQDILEAARFVFFPTDDPDTPFWSAGGTAFVVNYCSRPYALTCGHVLDKAEPGAEPVITDERFGNRPVRAHRAHRVRDLDGSVLDADMGDVAVIAFEDTTGVDAFEDTAYIINDDTVGTSERGDPLVVCGTLRDASIVEATEIRPLFATLEFDDRGATSDDPFIREAEASFDDPALQNLNGLSGSPVYNVRQRRLCGMVVRGGISNGLARIRYVDIFDIIKLLESVRTGQERVVYNKDVLRVSYRS